MKNHYKIKYSIGFIVNLLICYNLAISQDVVLHKGAINFTGGTISFSDGTSFSDLTYNSQEFGGVVAFVGSKEQEIYGASTLRFTRLVLDNASMLTLSSSIEISKDLRLNRGVLNIADNNIRIKKNAIIDGIIANKSMIATEQSGKLIWEVGKIGKYFIPIGDITGSFDFSPVNLDFKSGKFTNDATFAVSVKNTKHPKNTNSTNFLKRYWSIQTSGITNYSCNSTFVYVTSDIVGSETSISGGQLLANGTWKLLNKVTGSSINAGLSSFGDITGIPSTGSKPRKSLSDDIDMVITENGISLIPKNYVQLQKIEIYNKIGQLVYSNRLEPDSDQELSFNLDSDIFLIRITTNQSILSEKVYLP